MLSGVLAVTLPGFALGAVMMAIGSRRVPPAGRRGRWIKFGVYFAIVHGFLAVTAAGRPWIQGLVAGILVAGAFELRGATRRMIAGRPAAVWCGYLLVGGLALFNLWRLGSPQVAWLYVVVAVGDGFSQVSGQWFGRRKLTARISPGKTVEGLIGGLLGAMLAAAALRHLAGTGLAGALALGIAIGLAGLAGDLAASWVKRASGIKDYSNVLPGHGGVLDRFDSFLAAAAIAGAFL